MKKVKYLLIGSLVLSLSVPALAQEDSKATIESVAKLIKSKPADLDDQVKAVYKKNKKNAEVITGIASAYYEVKDTANARLYAEYALKANKQYAPAFVLLGDMAALDNDGGGAAAQYQQAIYFDPKSPEAYYKYASVYRKISPTEAVSKLEELRAQRPDIAVDAMAGRIYYMSNEFERAIDSYTKAWNSNRDKLEERDITEYAMSYYLTQKSQKCLDVVKYGLSKSPRDAAFNRLAFFSSTDLKDYDNALAYAEALFNKSDSAKFSYFDYTYYGNAYSGKKEYDKAIEMYQKALTMDIDNKDKRSGVVKQMSEAYKQMDDYDNAIKYYEEYLSDVSSPSASDKAGLATLYEYKADGEKDPATKLETFKKAEAIYADLEQIPEALEFATFKRARVNSYMDPDSKEGLAKPYYEKLVSLIEPRADKSSSDKARLVEANRYLGSYYLIVKDSKAEAEVYWKKILEVDPENEIAKKALGI